MRSFPPFLRPEPLLGFSWNVQTEAGASAGKIATSASLSVPDALSPIVGGRSNLRVDETFLFLCSQGALGVGLEPIVRVLALFEIVVSIY